MASILSIIFLIAPIISVPFIIIGIIKDKKHTYIYGIMLALVLGIIAYKLIPPKAFDLYRYNYLMSTYKELPWSELPNIMINSNKALFMVIMFIISKIGNLQLLPFIIVTIGYSIIFYMVLDYSKMKGLSGWKKVAILISFLRSFSLYEFHKWTSTVICFCYICTCTLF